MNVPAYYAYVGRVRELCNKPFLAFPLAGSKSRSGFECKPGVTIELIFNAVVGERKY